MRRLARRVSSFLCVVASAAAAVACGAGDASANGDEQDVTEAAGGATCPTADPAAIDALKRIPKVAASCDAIPPPPAAALRPFKTMFNSASSFTLFPLHRGRDLFMTPDEPQFAIGKFTYAPEITLEGEEVDVFVLRSCEGKWEKLGTATTTTPKQHATVQGVEDDGGRVFFRIPDAKKLPVGRHRIRMVVAGDGSAAEQIIEVLPKGTPILISDMDGTLTERFNGDPAVVCDEEAEFTALWRSILEGGAQPRLHDGAAAALNALADRGYRPMYLTARPEWLEPHSQGFMTERARKDGRGDLPRGIVHTTLGLIGAFNEAAEAFKKGELQMLKDKGLTPTFAFGNRKSDVGTYNAFGVPFRSYYENPDTRFRTCSQVKDIPLMSPAGLASGADRRITTYAALVPSFQALPAVCR